MTNVVNLNKFRKTKDRQDRRATADENAIKFGRTKSQKQSDKAAQDKANRHLEGHNMSDPDGDAT